MMTVTTTAVIRMLSQTYRLKLPELAITLDKGSVNMEFPGFEVRGNGHGEYIIILNQPASLRQPMQ